MRHHRIQVLNFISSGLLIAANIFFFIPMSYSIISTNGGSWGYGLLLAPITFVGHLYLIPSILTFKKEKAQSLGLLFINISGVIGTLFWIYIWWTS